MTTINMAVRTEDGKLESFELFQNIKESERLTYRAIFLLAEKGCKYANQTEFAQSLADNIRQYAGLKSDKQIEAAHNLIRYNMDVVYASYARKFESRAQNQAQKQDDQIQREWPEVQGPDNVRDDEYPREDDERP